MMEKTFEPASVEARIAKAWEDEGAFRAGRPERADAEPYCIVIPPPNVTGSLHIGHALNNTLQDVLCRFERMRGKDVLWQPGTDHAGIATQMVVERRLAQEQKPGRRDLGREAFLAEVWKQKEASEGTILGQLKRLGASCDWSRTRFTMDEGLSKAVLKVFVQLYRDGLIYRDKRLVNWDPKFQTAISDLEVVQVECKGSFRWERAQGEPLDEAALAKVLARNPNGHLYYIDYPLEGRAYDPDDATTYVRVATTRPETMLGDTGVAIHPDNETIGGLIGERAVLPLVGRTIPLVADTYADPEKGTGAVKITPAHDFNDFEVGRRHDLAVLNILDAEARIDLSDGDFGAAAMLHGLDRFAARARIVGMLAAQGVLVKVEPYEHTVPHGDRSNVVIEPYLTDQWYVNVKPLADRALDAVRDGRTRIVPETWEKTYYQWLENIEPWCISRQLWWGHQIPAWYGPDGQVYVAETEEEAVGAALAHAVDTGALESLEAAAIAEDPSRWSTFVTRDEDVLDTWFSSGLWPFSTLGWPDETPELAKFYPTSVLVTAFDIIFFWVARMMMLGLHFRDEVPFRDVYIHAIVRDEKGAKMSKSKGNVMDPLELIDRFGADAVRFTLAAMAAQGRDIKLAVNRVEGYRNFATKLWNAARFAEMNGCVRTDGFDPRRVEETLNRWVIGECAEAVAGVTAALEAYRFNDAAGAAYRFVWNLFCDWYLELAKPVLQGPDSPAKTETQAAVAFVLDEICKLLHPFMPFLTEELWAEKGKAGPARSSLLCLAPWPSVDGLEAPDAEAEIGWVVDLVTEVRSARAETNVPAGALVPLVFVGAGAATRERAMRWGDMVRRLARLSNIGFADEAPREAIQIVVRGDTALIPLAGVIDIAAEAARLRKEADRLNADVTKIDAKLANEDFLARAPEEVVDEQRERREEAQARLARIAEALTRLGGA